MWFYKLIGHTIHNNQIKACFWNNQSLRIFFLWKLVPEKIYSQSA